MRTASSLLVVLSASCMFACGTEAPGDPGVPTTQPTTTASTPPTTPPTTPPKPPEPPRFNAAQDAYSVTLYAVPAPSSLVNPAGLSWKTPGGLVRRTLVNKAGGKFLSFSRTIGHAAVRVQCDYYGDKAAAHFQGSMTNSNDDEFTDLLMKEQVGLGMLIYNVTGEIESEAAFQATLDERTASGRLAFIRFQISPDVCHDLLDYEKAYDAANVQKNYGLMARPLYKEGAGCSAFSMSFLELADLIEPRFTDNWSFNVRIPLYTDPLIGPDKALIGGSLYPQNKVPILRLSSLTRDWAKPTEPGVDLFGWDPTLMYEWIDKRAEEALADKSEPVEVRDKIKGLVLDRRTKPANSLLKTKVFFKK
jgi:hypothetical protein